MRKFAVLLSLSFLGTILLFEVTLRIIGFDFELPRYMVFAKETLDAIKSGGYLRDDSLFWKNAPLKGDINSSGLRGPQIEVKRNIRILCIGDSCTFGAGILYEDTYPHKLELLLKDLKLDAEVINAGVPNYSSLQGLRLFERDLLKLKPDIVIAEFGVIDQGYCYFYSDSEQKTRDTLNNFFISALNKSKISQFVYKKIFISSGKNRNLDLGSYPMIKPRVSAPEFYSNFKRLAAISDRNYIKLIFVKPVLFDFNKGSVNPTGEDYIFPEGYPILDLYEIFKKQKDLKDFFLERDFCHMNSRGNGVVANEILKVVIKEKFIHSRPVESRVR